LGKRRSFLLDEETLADQLLPGDTAYFDFGESGWKLEARRASEPSAASAR